MGRKNIERLKKIKEEVFFYQKQGSLFERQFIVDFSVLINDVKEGKRNSSRSFEKLEKINRLVSLF